MIRPTLLSGAALLISSLSASATVSFIINVDRVNDAAGDPVDVAQGIYLLVASTTDATFDPLMPGGISDGDLLAGSDDMVVHRGDFQTFFTPGVINANASLALGGGWDAGDPLALYWFPNAGLGATDITAGDSYGLYTSATGVDDSDPWITPPDGSSNHTLNVLSTDTNFFFGAGSIAPAALAANLVVVPEPSSGVLALLSLGVIALRRRR